LHFEISGSHGGEYEDNCLLGCCAVVCQKLTDVSEVLAASMIKAMLALMMEAASTSKTSVNVYQNTRRGIPEDNHLQLAFNQHHTLSKNIAPKSCTHFLFSPWSHMASPS
jgi:uncharacterized protein YkwD